MPQTVDRPMLSLTSKGRLALFLARLERCWDSLPANVQDDILVELQYVTRHYDRNGASKGAPA